MHAASLAKSSVIANQRARWLWQSVFPPSAAGFYVSDDSLSFCGERKGGKNAAKTKVLESFPRLKCRPRRFPAASRMGLYKTCAVLSYRLCASIRCPPTCASTHTLRRGGLLPRPPGLSPHALYPARRGTPRGRPFAPAPTPPVGRGDHTPPPITTASHVKIPVIAKPVRKLAVAIRNIPAPYPLHPPQQKKPSHPPMDGKAFSHISAYCRFRNDRKYLAAVLAAGGAFTATPSRRDTGCASGITRTWPS